MLAIHPTMGDFTKLMPRTATVIYPKDLGAILVSGDIFPGAKVLEAGCGSGAVTICLMRAVGETGHVYSYDIREDMVERTTKNVNEMLPEMTNVSIELGDVSSKIDHDDLDRIVLDLPEPWKVVENAGHSLKLGGILSPGQNLPGYFPGKISGAFPGEFPGKSSNKLSTSIYEFKYWLGSIQI